MVGDRIVEKPPMGVLGSTLASLLLELMGPYARSMQLGQVFSEVLFDLRPLVDGSRRPDLAFLSAAKWPLNRRGPEAESWPIIPDLAIEIVSPTNYAAKVLDKVREYEQAGVRLVWVIYPSAREVHIFDAGRPLGHPQTARRRPAERRARAPRIRARPRHVVRGQRDGMTARIPPACVTVPHRSICAASASPPLARRLHSLGMVPGLCLTA